MSDTKKKHIQPWQGDRSIKLLKSSRASTSYMKKYYEDLHKKVKLGEPIVWTSTWEPQEIMRAMGLNLFFMVHYSALCAAKQMSKRYLDNLQAHGWSRDICRYCGQRLGILLEKNQSEAPWGGPPKPNLIVRGSVDDIQGKIEEHMAEQMQVPIFLYDRTWFTRTSDNVWRTFDAADYRVDYVVKQYREMIAFLEHFFQIELDMNKLKEAVNHSVEMYRLWHEVDVLRQTVPAPITSADHYPNIIPLQFLRGTETGVEMLRKYRDEVKERVENKIAAVPNEEIRLIWPEIAPWFTPGIFNAFEKEYGAVFVFESYHFQEWYHKVDINDPIKALAQIYGVYVEDYANAPGKCEVIVEMAQNYKADGVIFMLVESCKAYSNAILITQRALAKANIPSMIIKQDIVDIRDWDDQKVKAAIGNFIETLRETKGLSGNY